MTDQALLFQRAEVGRPGDELGRFFTPARLAKLIVDEVASIIGPGPRMVVEPSVGGGAFVGPIRDRWPGADLLGVDVDHEAEGLAHCDDVFVGDWCRYADDWLRRPAPMFGGRRPDLVIGNPPFTKDSGRKNDKGEAIMEQVAHLHTEAALRLQPRCLAFILPWSYAGGVERWMPLLDAHPPFAIRPIWPRPWTKDVREVALYLWLEGHHETRWKPLPRWK